MEFHHVIQFRQNWPPDGRDIGPFRGAEGGLGADDVHDHAEAAVQIHEFFVRK